MLRALVHTLKLANVRLLKTHDFAKALSDDDINVDELAERVKRATELVKVCRERIAAARLEVKEIQLPEASR